MNAQAPLPLPAGAGLSDWIAAAHAVGRKLLADAAARDHAGADPVAEVALLRAHGLLPVYIPRDLGGGGASHAEILQVIRVLATYDTSVAHIAAYHWFGSRAGLTSGNTALIAARLDGFLNKSWFHGGIAQAGYEPLIEARQLPEGWVLTGAKPFTSGAAVADTILVWVRLAAGSRVDGADASGHIAQVIIPNPAKGLSFGNDWDNFGMRQTVSGSAALDGVQVGPEALLAHWHQDTVQPHHITLHVPLVQLAFGEFYLGTAIGALAEARDYIATQARPWLSSLAQKAGDDTLVIERFGKLSIALASAVALSDAAGQAVQRAFDRGTALTAQERAEAAVIAYQSKVHSTEVALEITARIFELTGARSSARKLGLDRFWRNVRVHSLHDPVHYKVLEVGDFALNGRFPPETYYS